MVDLSRESSVFSGTGGFWEWAAIGSEGGEKGRILRSSTIGLGNLAPP